MQVARALHIDYRNAQVRVTGSFSRHGSIIAGNATSVCDSLKTELQLDCDEPLERVTQLIKMAESTCFTINSLRNPTTVELESTVNGELLDLDGLSHS